MHRYEILYVLICINNHVLSCLIIMLSLAQLGRDFHSPLEKELTHVKKNLPPFYFFFRVFVEYLFSYYYYLFCYFFYFGT